MFISVDNNPTLWVTMHVAVEDVELLEKISKKKTLKLEYKKTNLLSTTGTAVAGLFFSPSMISGALSP